MKFSGLCIDGFNAGKQLEAQLPVVRIAPPQQMAVTPGEWDTNPVDEPFEDESQCYVFIPVPGLEKGFWVPKGEGEGSEGLEYALDEMARIYIRAVT